MEFDACSICFAPLVKSNKKNYSCDHHLIIPLLGLCRRALLLRIVSPPRPTATSAVILKPLKSSPGAALSSPTPAKAPTHHRNAARLCSLSADSISHNSLVQKSSPIRIHLHQRPTTDARTIGIPQPSIHRSQQLPRRALSSSNGTCPIPIPSPRPLLLPSSRIRLTRNTRPRRRCSPRRIPHPILIQLVCEQNHRRATPQAVLRRTCSR